MKRYLSISSVSEELSADPIGFVLTCEEYYHERIAKAALQLIRNRQEKPIVLISGPSGSGKTTTSLRLERYLDNACAEAHSLSLDDYFIPKERRNPNLTDFESPLLVDIELLQQDLKKILNHEPVQTPKFNFEKQSREEGKIIHMKENEMIILEGLHALNPLLTGELQQYATGLFIAPRTRLETPFGIIEPKQLRLARRLLRDHYFRARSFEQIVVQAQSVDAGEDKYIRPYKKYASLSIDTFLDYELILIASIMKEQGAVRQQIPHELMEEYHLETLVDTMDMVPFLDKSVIPYDSLLREFIGGSTALTYHN